MKNEQMDAAKVILAREGLEPPERVIFDLINAIVGAKPVVYERGDFIYYREGMGEAWHGEVLGSGPGSYRIKRWTHDEEASPSYQTWIGEGDVIRLATQEDAMDYYLVRTGQKSA